jgi:hypothetical protein
LCSSSGTVFFFSFCLSRACLDKWSCVIAQAAAVSQLHIVLRTSATEGIREHQPASSVSGQPVSRPTALASSPLSPAQNHRVFC